MSDLAYINKRLVDTYGLTLDNRPKWRVILGKDGLEKRLGTFRDFTEGGIYLRTVTEVREVKKYPAWQTYHILERVVPFHKFGEVVEHDGYECFWRFADHNDKPMPANWRYVNLLCRWAETGAFTATKKSPSDLTDEERKQEEEEQKAYHELLFGNETGLGDSLAAHEGVSFAGLDSKNPALAEKVD